jgi:hypothetical protein
MVLVAFAEPGLKLWLGTAYDPGVATALRWLAAAVYVNTVGQVPYFLLQSGVDARAVGIVHALELPVFFAATYAASVAFGPAGAAAVWFGRMAVDALVLWTILHRRLPLARPAIGRIMRLWAACLAGVALAALWGLSRT